MNLIVFLRSTGGTRHLTLSPVLLAALLMSSLAVLMGSFGLGYGLARSQGFLPANERVDALQAQVAQQQSAVAEARTAAQDHIDALAIRLGDLNAHVIRLDALGSRLAAMARLTDGEFDFSARPALGGPDEPSLGAQDMDGLAAGLDDLDARLNRQQQQLQLLSTLLLDRKLDEEARPRGRPVRAGYISSHFGRRTDPFTGQLRQHRGIDFAAKSGVEIISVGTGVVTWAGYRQGYGRMVEVNHGNGYVTRYAHNAQNLVGVGDHVRQGETIALMGATGRATGSNLHFEVWHKGRPVDPSAFVGKAG